MKDQRSRDQVYAARGVALLIAGAVISGCAFHVITTGPKTDLCASASAAYSVWLVVDELATLLAGAGGVAALALDAGAPRWIASALILAMTGAAITATQAERLWATRAALACASMSRASPPPPTPDGGVGMPIARGIQ